VVVREKFPSGSMVKVMEKGWAVREGRACTDPPLRKNDFR